MRRDTLTIAAYSMGPGAPGSPAGGLKPNRSPIGSAPVEQDRKGGNSLQVDVLVYVGITALVLLAWWISKLGLFEPGDRVGYWIGLAGTLLMVLLFSYPLRKYFRFARHWGPAKWWLLAHMVLGVGGPFLILVHSSFRIGSLNAGVALYSMLVVAASGVIGRFIYARVNRGLHGEKASLRDLQVQAGLEEEEARSRLSFAPAVETRLLAFEQGELKAKLGWLTHTRQIFWLPLTQWLTYRRCVADLRPVLDRLAQQEQWSQADLVRRVKQTKKLVSKYLYAVTRVAQYTAYARLFSLWHIAHIPFVYLLVISTVVHVIAVHIY